jgi:hypothetical protein
VTVGEVVNLNPKLATDILVRLGDDVRALGELGPRDVLAAKLVFDSTGDPLTAVEALETIIATLSLIRDETAAAASESRAMSN